jgi:hypothetical protein
VIKNNMTTLTIKLSDRQRFLDKVPITANPETMDKQLVSPFSIQEYDIPVVKVVDEQKQELADYKTFQVIPHSALKNDKINRFADILADSYKELIVRLRSGIKAQDQIFFETVMTNKSFRTYITSNSEIVEMVKQHTQMVWKYVTLVDCENPVSVKVDPEFCMGFNLRLKRHFFLSLKTDRRISETPLPEILELARVMNDEDKVIIQFGFQAAEEDWFKDAEDERKYFEAKPPYWWNKGRKFMDSTNLKPGQYGFDFILRLMVICPEERRKRRMAHGAVLALKQLNDDNELEEKSVKPSKLKKWIESISRHQMIVPWLLGRRNIITNSEISHFIKLPQKKLQEEYPVIEHISKPELSLPNELFLENVRSIEIGKVIEKGNTRTARIPVEAFNKIQLKYVLDAYCLPEFVFGEMGSGKTGEAIHRAHSAICLGQTVFFFDTADGAAVKELHNSLPADYPENKIIHIDATNKASPIALTWGFHSTKMETDDDLAAEQAREAGKMFLRQFVGGMATTNFTDRMDRYLSSVARSAGSSPLEIELALTSPAYREELMQKEFIRTQPEIMLELEALQQKAKRGSEDVSVDGILSRLRTLSSDLFRTNLFFQTPTKPLTFRHYADNPDGGYGYCVTIFCDKNSFGPDGQEAIMTFLLAKVLLEGAYSRVDISDIDQRKPFVVILDEPHRFIKGEMATKLGEDAAVELRKYRCKLVMINHSRAQLGKLWDAFESGGIQVTMYKSKNVRAFHEMASILAPLDPIQAWSSLAQHEAVVTRQLPSKKEVSFICKMTAPPAFVMDRSKRREACAREYGKPWKEVSRQIQARRLEYLQKDKVWHSRIEQLAQELKEQQRNSKKDAKARNKSQSEEGDMYG